ncbi:MAG: Hsp20 family protein [Alphaproteobacteria bacterium]
MSRYSYFNSPFLLGFDEIERMLDRIAKSGNDSYPPYNIEQLDSQSLRITLAVAGFAADELEVTVEDNQLVIRGRRNEDAERSFLHRGIATRQFQRAFILAEGIEVGGARLENGLLSIDLRRPQVSAPVQRIRIDAGSGQGGPMLVDRESETKRRA